jgi:phosphatidyl-myo-inositol alpha-mannosyltransferase
MRIAITHPTTFSRVRRGTERLAQEGAIFMAQRGHEVTFIACKPGPAEKVNECGFLFDYHRRWWHPALARIGFLEHHGFLGSSFWKLLRERFDLVHSYSFTDGYAATLARAITGVPNVLTVNAIPPKAPYVRSLTLGGAVFKRAVRQSDEVVVFSRYVNEYCVNRWGRTCVEIPAPVDLERFPLCRERNLERPIILCTAALDDARKGGRVLMSAFNRVKAVRPEVVMQISCSIAGEKLHDLLQLVNPQWRRDVEFLGLGRSEDLPALYGRAAVSVLPSLWEAFGMVVVESMATGTPAVGTRSGALPEIISNQEVGFLFDPGPIEEAGPSNDEGLAEALLRGLDLSRHAETPERCRLHAEQFSWKTCAPRLEAIYQRLVGEKRN